MIGEVGDQPGVFVIGMCRYVQGIPEEVKLLERFVDGSGRCLFRYLGENTLTTQEDSRTEYQKYYACFEVLSVTKYRKNRPGEATFKNSLTA